MTPEQFLADFPPQTRELARRTRNLVKDAVPDISEKVYQGWRLIGYRVHATGQASRSRGAYFCFIAPGQDALQLGFEYGILLHDLTGLLVGDGKQVRYVTVSRANDLSRPGMRELIVEAARVASLPKEQKAALRFELEEIRELNQDH